MTGIIAALFASIRTLSFSSVSNVTTLLLSGDGTNGANNNIFIDSSNNNFTITRNGGTTQGSYSPYVTTGGSGYFDGVDDYLSIADNVNLRPGSGPFTLEAWIYRKASGADHTIYAKGGASTGVLFQVTSGNVLRFTDTTTNIDSVGTIAGNTWTHVTVVREGTGSNQTKLYIDGVNDGQGTVSTNFTETEEARIGTDRSAGSDFNGYISDLRFVKGTAVYTANFTKPASPLTAIANTNLLCKFTNAAIFDSSRKTIIETTGNAQINTTIKKFGTGSIKFDGNGDSLKFLVGPNNVEANLGSEDFTIEFWIYANSWSSSPTVYNIANILSPVDIGTGLSGAFGISSDPTFLNGIGLYSWGGGSGDGYSVSNTPLSSFSTGVWYHFAFTRASGTTRMFVDGTLLSSSTKVYTGNFGLNPQYIAGGPSNGWFDGYIDDFRITKGSALYTSNFTPPSSTLVSGIISEIASNAVIWFSADSIANLSDGAKVNTWINLGTGGATYNANIAVAGTISKNTVDGIPAIHISTDSSFNLANTINLTGGNCTLVLVTKQTSSRVVALGGTTASANGNCFWGSWQNDSSGYLYRNSSDGGWTISGLTAVTKSKVFCIQVIGTSSITYFDNSTTPVNVSPTLTGNFVFGAIGRRDGFGTQYSRGYISEIMVFTNLVPTSNCQILVEALKQKYLT
jgi:hypothetical protein